MMVCERCGADTYCIYITKKYERVCADCYDKKEKKEKEEAWRKYFEEET